MREGTAACGRERIEKEKLAASGGKEIGEEMVTGALRALLKENTKRRKMKQFPEVRYVGKL